MDSKTLREKFLKFFERNGHKIIPSASLVPSEEEQLVGEERVLFTSAGMQPLIPYLTGQKEPPSKRLVDVQKCLRTDDIEEVGDGVHHTFFEMLGNWSIGDYWKEEAIRLSFGFLTEELAIPVKKLAVTVFAGDDDAPKDEESARIWKNLGIPEERIFYFGKSHNWWPTGEKSGPCGPDTEMFYWIGEGEAEGKPNEDSRWVEIWNDVFMEFDRKEDGTLEELPQKNVDTGMGLERTLAVLNGKKSDYETDLFEPIIEEVRKSKNTCTERSRRIIADHLKAAVFLIADGVEPSNKYRGYILRRLIRRAYTQMYISEDKDFSLSKLVGLVTETYKEDYPYINDQVDRIEKIIEIEENAYKKALESGLQIWAKSVSAFRWITDEERGKLLSGINSDLMPSAEKVFFLYQSFGVSPEVLELLTGTKIDREGFNRLFKEHQQKSRGVEVGKFKGGLVDHSEIVTKYHTATHLLHQALRDVLGPQIFQKGSNITSERLRFDFSFDRKLTDEEIKQVKDLVNKRIEEDLKVDRITTSPDEAKKMNAIGLFDEKYGTEVSIYGIGPDFKLDPASKDQRDRGGYYSLEFCGGPHVEHTGIIGKIKITKEEAVSSGIRRIRAQIMLE